MKKFLAVFLISALVFASTPTAFATPITASRVNDADDLTNAAGSQFDNLGAWTLTVADNADFTNGFITTAGNGGANAGTVTFAGTTIINTALSANVLGTGANALLAINAGATGETVTINGDAFATTFTVSGTGTVNADSITATTLNFAADGTVSVDTAENIAAAVTATTNNTGTLTLEGTTTVSGQVGTATAVLKEINAGVVATTATFSSNVFTTLMDVTGTGNVALNGNFGSSSFATGVIDFEAAGGTVTYADSMFHFGSYTTQNAGQGNLTFSGTSTVSGVVGSNANYLNTITANGAGETLTFGSNVFATDVTQGAANTLNIGANTVDLNGTADGDFTMFAGGTLGLTLSGASAFGNILATGATGTAVVAASNILNVRLNYAVTNGQTFAIITATDDGVAAVPGTITDNSAFFSFSAAEPTAGDIVLTANSNAVNVATTENTAAVLTAINGTLVSGASADFNSAIGQLYSISSNAEATAALESLAPDTNAGSLNASREIASRFLGSVSDRLGYVRSGGFQKGVATGDALDGIGFWLQGFGSHAKQDARNGDAGYQANIFGTAIGVDKLLDEHVRVGLAGGYGLANVDSKGAGRKGTDVDSFQGALYASYDSLNLSKKDGYYENGAPVNEQVDDNSWYVDSMLSFTQNNYDSHRTILLGGANTRMATADHSGQQYSTKIETGYTFRSEAMKSLEATPFASIGYNYLHMGDYTEKGADALNLHVRGEGYHAVNQALGLKLAYPILSKRAGVFTPSVKAAWLLDYMGERVKNTSSFSGGGPSFKTQGAEPAQNGFLLGAELAFLNQGNMTLTANWDMELRDQYMNNTCGAAVRFDL